MSYHMKAAEAFTALKFACKEVKFQKSFLQSSKSCKAVFKGFAKLWFIRSMKQYGFSWELPDIYTYFFGTIFHKTVASQTFIG